MSDRKRRSKGTKQGKLVQPPIRRNGLNGGGDDEKIDGDDKYLETCKKVGNNGVPFEDPMCFQFKDGINKEVRWVKNPPAGGIDSPDPKMCVLENKEKKKEIQYVVATINDNGVEKEYVECDSINNLSTTTWVPRATCGIKGTCFYKRFGDKTGISPKKRCVKRVSDVVLNDGQVSPDFQEDYAAYLSKPESMYDESADWDGTKYITTEHPLFDCSETPSNTNTNRGKQPNAPKPPQTPNATKQMLRNPWPSLTNTEPMSVSNNSKRPQLKQPTADNASTMRLVGKQPQNSRGLQPGNTSAVRLQQPATNGKPIATQPITPPPGRSPQTSTFAPGGQQQNPRPQQVTSTKNASPATEQQQMLQQQQMQQPRTNVANRPMQPTTQGNSGSAMTPARTPGTSAVQPQRIAIALKNVRQPMPPRPAMQQPMPPRPAMQQPRTTPVVATTQMNMRLPGAMPTGVVGTTPSRDTGVVGIGMKTHIPRTATATVSKISWSGHELHVSYTTMINGMQKAAQKSIRVNTWPREYGKGTTIGLAGPHEITYSPPIAIEYDAIDPDHETNKKIIVRWLSQQTAKLTSLTSNKLTFIMPDNPYALLHAMLSYNAESSTIRIIGGKSTKRQRKPTSTSPKSKKKAKVAKKAPSKKKLI